MKALVVYDSYYGNTEKIAQVIAAKPTERRQMDRTMFLQRVADCVTAIAFAHHRTKAVADQPGTERIHAGRGRRAGRADDRPRPGRRRTNKVDDRTVEIDRQLLAAFQRGAKPLVRHIAGGVHHPAKGHFIARLQLPNVGLRKRST